MFVVTEGKLVIRQVLVHFFFAEERTLLISRMDYGNSFS
jgi:hypothetical protein